MCSHHARVWALMIVLTAGHASAQTPGIHGFPDIETRLAMQFAIEGAATRLARPGCQRLFTDFEDRSGQPLASKLAKSGRSITTAFSSLQFFDARGSRECRESAKVLAFTKPGASAIMVCGDRFRRTSRGSPTWTEIVVIHEFLHALGLGENPPTSRAITEQVQLRCSE